MAGHKPFDIVDIRFVHPGHELTCICTKTFGIAALTFGEKRVDGQGGFSRAGDAGHHDQLVAGNADIDILKVVDPGSFYKDGAIRPTRWFARNDLRSGIDITLDLLAGRVEMLIF